MRSKPWMSRFFAGAATLASLFVAQAGFAAEWFDENAIRGYEYTGPYAQFGIAIGQIDYDDVAGIKVDSEASGGFTLGAGYRFSPWLAGEFNFSFLGGNDNVELGSLEGDSQVYAFTIGPKIYPLALIEAESIPHFVQPYATIGIGGGAGEIDGPGNASVDEDSFVARFILGFDVWATDQIGFFVEGGGLVAEEDSVEGVGIFTFGAQYRF